MVLCAGPATARADALWITGTFGNENGCRSIVENGARNEDVVVLRSDSIERYESHCGILNVLSSAGGWALLDAICGGEGETWAERFLFQQDPDDLKKVRFSTGAAGEFTELSRCD